jgi:glucose-1-phosphate thymidylyltransferase|tara:strand:+ start:7074 stop:8132 length:1059 start_codon:yes stop_codon:yes gene_type:complete
MKGIILHAGHGTRLRPLTHTGPKQLLPIANKPMSEYCIESLKDAGVYEIAIVIGGVGSNKVQEYYENGEKFGVKLTYIQQDSPRGIAHAISLCKNFIENEKFIVFLGDNFINTSITDFRKNFENSNDDASLLLCNVDNPQQFGIAYLDGNKISRMIEKPKNPESNLAITGIYFLTPKIFEKIKQLKPSWRNELEIVDALQMILDDKGIISYNIITDFWKDTGTPEDIIDANRTILEKIKPNNVINHKFVIGNVSIGKNSIINNECQINGPVIIGENCILDGKSVIGPNVSIGNNTQITDCKIKNSIVMNNCQINTKISITDSIIASNSNISLQIDNKNDKKFLLGEGTKLSL